MIEQRTPYTHGGARPGSGPKPRHGEPMVQTTVRLPPAWIARLVAEYGSLQKAIETLAQAHLAE